MLVSLGFHPLISANTARHKGNLLFFSVFVTGSSSVNIRLARGRGWNQFWIQKKFCLCFSCSMPPKHKKITSYFKIDCNYYEANLKEKEANFKANK
jgi:hypothetical protein